MMQDKITFRVDEEVMKKVKEIENLLGGNSSDKHRSIFLFGLENSMKLIKEGYTPFPVKFQNSELNKLKFLIEDKKEVKK